MRNKYQVKGEKVGILIEDARLGTMTAIISIDKLEKVIAIDSWIASVDKKTGAIYIVGRKNLRNIKLHRLIMDAPDDKVVDHINHNALDNTNENLRLVSRSENGQNRKGPTKASKSGVRGVSWNESSKKWRTRVKVNGVEKAVGYYSTLEEAEQAVIKARKELMTHSER